MHTKNSVILTNKPRSTTSNPKQCTADLHKYVRYQSHTPNGSPVIIWKPSVMDLMDVMDGTLFPSVTAKCPQGGHNYMTMVVSCMADFTCQTQLFRGVVM